MFTHFDFHARVWLSDETMRQFWVMFCRLGFLFCWVCDILLGFHTNRNISLGLNVSVFVPPVSVIFHSQLEMTKHWSPYKCAVIWRIKQTSCEGIDKKLPGPLHCCTPSPCVVFQFLFFFIHLYVSFFQIIVALTKYFWYLPLYRWDNLHAEWREQHTGRHVKTMCLLTWLGHYLSCRPWTSWAWCNVSADISGTWPVLQTFAGHAMSVIKCVEIYWH